MVRSLVIMDGSRAPYGARGLKYGHFRPLDSEDESRPVWGAWIEMMPERISTRMCWSRAPYGARGLKLMIRTALHLRNKVAPRMGRVD